MTRPKTRIKCRDLGAAGALVRLPRVFWLYLEFRRTFRQARQAWTWVVPGPRAMSRIGAFDRLHGDKAAADLRRREQARRDAEWEAAGVADSFRRVA